MDKRSTFLEVEIRNKAVLQVHMAPTIYYENLTHIYIYTHTHIHVFVNLIQTIRFIFELGSIIYFHNIP